MAMPEPCSSRRTPAGCSGRAPARSTRSTCNSMLPWSFRSPPYWVLLSDLVQVRDELGPAAHQVFLLETTAAERLAPEALRDLFLLPREGIGPRLRGRTDLAFTGDPGAVLVLGVARQQVGLPGGDRRGPAHLLALDERHGIQGVASGALRVAAEVPERVGIEEVFRGALGAGEHQPLFNHFRSPPPLPSWRFCPSSTRGADRKPSRCRRRQA